MANSRIYLKSEAGVEIPEEVSRLRAEARLAA